MEPFKIAQNSLKSVRNFDSFEENRTGPAKVWGNSLKSEGTIRRKSNENFATLKLLEGPRHNFSLLHQYDIKQTSDEDKSKI